MILFGHPTGSPFAHHAALAHFEQGQLEAFCVSWMPTPAELRLLGRIPRLHDYVQRLSRRRFAELADAPLIEGRPGEWWRMARRIMFGGRFASEALSYEANDWLMRVMRDSAARSSVTAVHSYEDCSLWSFERARQLGKACIYNLPIGYYPAWERKQDELARRFADWLPPGGLRSSRFVRPEQKRREMELADLVLVPCSFVRGTVEQFADKKVALAPFGVDLEFWTPDERPRGDTGKLRFIYAGQCSLRKGIPDLLEAWRQADLKDATLELVGGWHFSEAKKKSFPAGVHWTGPLSSAQLRERYRQSDVFVFPSYFEGFALVILEAMACGLPVITTEATAGPDILDDGCGRIVPSGEVEQWVEMLRWFGSHRDGLPAMRAAARARAGQHGWKHYRDCVTAGVAGLV
jgi:glycosyltransferase involved in cell wall biosynthesis